jgi:hypothetical protein
MLAERPFLDGIHPMTVMPRSPLRRFVTDGLRDTIDSYTAATLPLHRFAWELESRLNTLAELTGLPHWRTLNVLRAAHATIADLDTHLRATMRDELTPAEQHLLAGALATLRTTLARLDPDDPIDPVDPAAPRPVLLTLVPSLTQHSTRTHPALIA